MLVTLALQDAVATMTLNRPERRNALGAEMMSQLADGLDAALTSGDVGAIVLTGAPPAFCAGSDLKELAGLSPEAMAAHEAVTASIVARIAHSPKPVVAAVEGYALGGGMALAAACDVVVSSDVARWHMPEVGNGWLPPWGLAGLVNRLGLVRARLMTLGAEPINGAEAHWLGLVDHVTDAGDALVRARGLAASLARLPREAVAATKCFFAPLLPANGLPLDDMASAVFVANCRSPEARATFARFGARP